MVPEVCHLCLMLLFQILSRSVLSLLLLCSLRVGAQTNTVKVGINDRITESGVLVAPLLGKYVVLDEDGDTLYFFRTDDVVSVQAVGDSIVVRGVYGMDTRTLFITITGTGQTPSFILRNEGDGKEFSHQGDLKVHAVANRLVLVNVIDIDAYVARVVQSEVGDGAESEYYKIQSIICRTYVMGNRGRHSAQGFDVCDHQHCQMFDGKKQPNEVVMKATAATSAIVMVDTSMRPILAAYHANCGGQTANAQDVWTESRTYLVSVSDTFCTDQRSANWSEQISLEAFIAYVGSDSDTMLRDGFVWQQSQRLPLFELGADRFRTVDMRREFQLRSAFFSMEVKQDQVQLSGRGFGHGVGLCQQGAMKMARQGFTYGEILGHYYSGVSLVNVSALKD